MYLVPAVEELKDLPEGATGACLVFSSLEEVKKRYPDLDESCLLIVQDSATLRGTCPSCMAHNTIRCIRCRRKI